jgi:predicted small lipoprotein YifL
MKPLTWVLVVCASGVVAACGQKGALYLPDKNASVVTRPAGSNNPAPAQPTPAPGTSQPPQDKDKDKSDDDDSQSSKPKN